MRLLKDSLRDARHALRLFRAAPGFAAAAMATLALGIGATSAIFSVVRTVLIEPLPYRDADRIVTVWETVRGGADRNVIAAANFVAWRERTHTLEHLGMVGPLVLLAGAGLLMRSFVRLQQVDLGFRTDGVLTLSVQLPVNRYDLSQSTAFFRELLSQTASLPGAQQAAGATCLPVPFACIGTNFWRVDRPKPADGQLSSGEVRPITPELFKTIGIPQIAGRDFSESDTVTSLPVAIVSEALARQQFGNESPLGRRLRINVDHANGREDVEWTIVGVVGNTRSSLDGPVKQTIYVPRPQRPSNNLRFFVRSAQDPAVLATTVTRLVHSREGEAPVQSITLEEAVGRTIARPRALSWLVAVFALAALALAAVGVYGVTAYSVRQRTQEIGVRMALGATAPSVLRLVLGQAVQLVAIGVVTGLVAAAALTRLIERMLFEVGPFDPFTFSGTALLLVLVGTVASYVPTRRCIALAPLDALRTN